MSSIDNPTRIITFREYLEKYSSDDILKMVSEIREAELSGVFPNDAMIRDCHRAYCDYVRAADNGFYMNPDIHFATISILREAAMRYYLEHTEGTLQL